ncbi:MAG: hypothetical protein KAS12_04750, partial [Candidatus Aenigmarchaeota archaeon]|nr:hypothetical protein [Candidatus Aenigmarchaeota archaeon]
FAYDLLSNINWSYEGAGSANRSFNITDIYHFSQPIYNIYNRGENLTLTLLDINNNTVLDANWTVNITKYNASEKNVLNETANLYTYDIKTNDTDGNYSLFANASKNKNYVYTNHKFLFNASSKLFVYINTTFESEYDPNENIPYFTSSVYNIHHTELTDITTTLNYNSYIEDMSYISGLFRSLTQYKAPTTSNTIKTSIINASDTNNNTGVILTNIKTKVSATPPGGGGGGSSSSSGGGGINFAPTTILENKTLIINFDFFIENSERIFMTGYQDTVMATITNTGDLPITIYTKISSSPINITTSNNFTLDVGMDKSFRITLSSNLSTPSEIYYADIILYNEKLK